MYWKVGEKGGQYSNHTKKMEVHGDGVRTARMVAAPLDNTSRAVTALAW